MDSELTTGNEGVTLYNNDNRNNERGNLATADRSDSPQIALISTALGNSTHSNNEDPLNDKSSGSYKIPLKATQGSNGDDVVTQDSSDFNAYSRSHQATDSTEQALVFTSTITYGNKESSSSGEPVLTGNGDSPVFENEQDKLNSQGEDLSLITSDKSYIESRAVTQRLVINNAQDIISDTVTSQVASSSGEENISVQQNRGYYNRHNSHTETTTGNYHYSDTNMSSYQSYTEHANYSAGKNISTESSKELISEKTAHNTAKSLVKDTSALSPLTSTTHKGPTKAKSTTKTGQELQPRVWTASQLTVGAFIVTLTVIMTISLFIVVLWRRRSYYHNTSNILHLQEFKTFHR